jgi:hypothetical protein
MYLGQIDDYGLVSEPPGTAMVEYQDQAPTAGGSPSLLDQIVSFGQKLIPVALSLEQQRGLNDLNMQRARMGLPPLNTSQYMAQSAPQVRFGMTSDVQNLVMYGGAALLGVWLLSSMMKR